MREPRSSSAVFGGQSAARDAWARGVRSLKAAASVVLLMMLLIPVVSWVVARAIEFEAAGTELSLPWRLTLAATNWYVRLLPFIAIGGVGFAALVGGLTSRGTSLVEERRLLGAWLVLSVTDFVLPFVPYAKGRWWSEGLLLIVAVGIVAPVAAVVVAAHLQSRIRGRLASRVRGWHVAAASLGLAVLGPAALIPPVWVWARAGKAGGDPPHD